MRVKQRLDTGLFFIAKDNGDFIEHTGGRIMYFADIRDALRLKEQLLQDGADACAVSQRKGGSYEQDDV